MTGRHTLPLRGRHNKQDEVYGQTLRRLHPGIGENNKKIPTNRILPVGYPAVSSLQRALDPDYESDRSMSSAILGIRAAQQTTANT